MERDDAALELVGERLLATAARVWPSPAMSGVQRQADELWVHAGPAAGVVFRHIGVPLETARQLVLFGTARGVFSAAVRLGLVGSYEAQRLQFEAAPWLEEQCARSAALDEHDLAQTAPIATCCSLGTTLYSSLFQS